MYLDIHSHILHKIDDGAEDLSVSLALISDIYNQGITDIIATPHFYPLYDNLEDFEVRRQKRYLELMSKLQDIPHPNIYLGCELLYYSGISNASSLKSFTLNGSQYILLEPDYSLINNHFFNEILHLRELGFKPIIAHLERYKKARSFKKLLSFIKDNDILVQVNATAFYNKHYNRLIKKMVKEDLITFMASDTHSIDVRPPLIKGALDIITEKYGKDYCEKLCENTKKLLLDITEKENAE